MSALPRHHRHDDERAFALPAAILLGMVALILIVAAGTYTMGRKSDHDRRRDRVVAMPVVDTAVTRLKLALEHNLLAEENEYVPTSTALMQLVSGTDATPLTNVVMDPPIPPGMPNVTFREPGQPGSETIGYWQLLRVFAPEYEDPADEGMVVAYLRAWSAPVNALPSAGTEPRLVRIEFRPGRFADYQAVIDGPILFGPGATLNGPVHSNGFPDDRANLKDVLENSNERVSTTANNVKVPCTGAGQITTAEGTVKAADFPGCVVQTNTRRYVNLLAAEEAFKRMRKACAVGSARVHCYNELLDHPSQMQGSSVPSTLSQKAPDLRGYRVQLSATSIKVTKFEVNWVSQTVEQYGSWSKTISTPKDSTNVLLFDDSVMVEGTTKARVTIAARKPDETLSTVDPSVKSGGATIYITGNVGSSGTSAVLGLLAQGGVLLQSVQGEGCVSNINAAIMSMSGTLTIDPRYTTRLYQGGGPKCGTIEVRGSIAAHRSPVLYWTWDNVTGYTGYSTRIYSWDKDMRRNPPPYFPTTDVWESRHVRPANLDCFSDGDITDPDC
ncbi:MAG: hypothetical protein KDC46_11730 [Thermoleophilia bacterium]|nr:hypothetical protein [Thermoleophilia bacterium]